VPISPFPETEISTKRSSAYLFSFLLTCPIWQFAVESDLMFGVDVAVAMTQATMNNQVNSDTMGANDDIIPKGKMAVPVLFAFIHLVAGNLCSAHVMNWTSV
jgi:hypothetical protein